MEEKRYLLRLKSFYDQYPCLVGNYLAQTIDRRHSDNIEWLLYKTEIAAKIRGFELYICDIMDNGSVTLSLGMHRFKWIKVEHEIAVIIWSGGVEKYLSAKNDTWNGMGLACKCGRTERFYPVIKQ